MVSLCLVVLASVGAQVAPPTRPLISLSQAPLVMRLSKDEFRIAFGIAAEQCAANGCHGLIRYRVNWKTEDGITRSEIKTVSYVIAAHTGRSITVDRQYFDTAEGQHRTEIVNVSVADITCEDGATAQAL